MKRKKDNILDNNYNTNDISFSVLPDIKVDPAFRGMNPENVDSYDHHKLQQLEEFIILELNKFNIDELKKNRKKTLDVFYLIYEKLDLRYYTEVEFFIYFCEMLKLNIKEFYMMILPKLRTKLLISVTSNMNNNTNRIIYHKLF